LTAATKKVHLHFTGQFSPLDLTLMDTRYWIMPVEQLLERAVFDPPSNELVQALAAKVLDYIDDLKAAEAQVDELQAHITFLEEELDAYRSDIDELQNKEMMR
jgi:phage shock protein A